MSLVLDRHNTHPDNASSRPDAERHATKANGKTKTLRLDSPTTIEACAELGILIDELRPKTLDDFKDGMIEEEIVQVRFNHYLKRYNQYVTDVFARKRELTRAKNRNRRSSKNIDNTTGLKSYGVIGNSRQNLNNSEGVDMMRHSNSANNTLVPPAMLMNYNKTMAYLRTSHDTAQTKDMIDILGNETSMYDNDGVTERFDNALSLEVNKFNKIKRQKQKEALDAYEEEMKRVQMKEYLEEKEKKKHEREKKLVVDRKKQEEERKRRAEDKLDQIRDAERKYRQQKQEEKDKIKKRLEETKKKIAEEAEMRRQQIAANEERLEQKRRRAEEMRQKLKEDEQAKCDQLRMEIQMKLNQCHDKHNMTLNEKTSRVKFQIQKIEENVHRIREKQEHDNEEFVQKLVEKLVKKEESSQAFQKQQFVALKKREQELAEKNSRFFGNKSDLNQAHKDRMKEINDRFKKVQENLAIKREQEEKALKLKQEMSRLKILDKQENYNRKQRVVAHERQKVLDRAKYNEHKLLELKHQRDILQQAKVEVSIQSKIEKDRIEASIQQLSKVITEGASTEKMTDAQKKILKDILTPEDYHRLESIEKKKEQDRLEAEEARKNGLLGIIPAAKAR